MKMFDKAIVRRPAETLAAGITTAGLGEPNYKLALTQHDAYVEALQSCGLDVIKLEADSNYPDSVFIEDAALMTTDCAVLTRPGADSRRGEVQQIRSVIETFYDTIYWIASPGTVEAGDVMMVGSHFYIGLSERTNLEGANQLIQFLERHGMSASVVAMSEFLHLKTGLSYLENNNLLISGEFVGREEFAGFNQIIVEPEQAYAANSVYVNGKVLVPSGYPAVCGKISQAGYPVIELEMSEFQKLDGGLSCLSLRF